MYKLCSYILGVLLKQLLGVDPGEHTDVRQQPPGELGVLSQKEGQTLPCQTEIMGGEKLRPVTP